MANRSIRLHPKHGVNPMLTNCFYCGESSGIALLGSITTAMKKGLAEAGAPVSEDGEAPRQGVVLDKEPCQKCTGYMEMGVIAISIDEKKSDDMENPYRSGGWCVMSEDWVKRVIHSQDLIDHILKRRVVFIPDDAWDAMELPRVAQEKTA